MVAAVVWSDFANCSICDLTSLARITLESTKSSLKELRILLIESDVVVAFVVVVATAVCIVAAAGGMSQSDTTAFLTSAKLFLHIISKRSSLLLKL